MEEKQKINCMVESCKYLDSNQHQCTLKQITVEPELNINSENTDESKCGSYKCGE